MTNPQARLHVVMRSYGGENSKGRPDYYSKLTCLASLVRAAEAVHPDPELIFVNDGPIPTDREKLMRSAGEIVQLNVGSNRSSYRTAVGLARRRNWADTDLVWFAEDDYLYTPHAFVNLIAAADEVVTADYFSMYGGYAFDTSTGRLHPSWRPERGASGDPSAVTIGATRWFRGLSTTSSFGVRRRVLAQDCRLLRLLPCTGGAWDQASCLTYQGLRPFSRRELAADLLPLRREPSTSRSRRVLRGLVRLAMSTRALRRASRRRVLLGSDPDLIGHMELGLLSPGTDWELLAKETGNWRDRRRATSLPADAQ